MEEVSGKCDLVLIGGGPAGTSAAISAARRGARVLLLERGSLPRQRVCGEFVSAESLGLLDTLLADQDATVRRDALPIREARLFLDGQTLTTPIDPPAASISRSELDWALWNSAIRSGVDARLQTAAHSISRNGELLVKTSDRTFSSRAVVDCSGRWSNLMSLGPENKMPLGKWIGIKCHFQENNLSTSVDLYFFEGGYCGVQPVAVNGGHAPRVNVCAMVQVRRATSLRDVFALHPELRKRSEHWQPLSDPVSTFPLMFREPQTERNGILLAGDAAGFIDPFAGDGISLALRSGALAAECLVPFFANRATLKEATRQYRTLYQQQFSRAFRSSSKIRRMLLLPRSLRKPVLAVLGRAPSVTRYLLKATR